MCVRDHFFHPPECEGGNSCCSFGSPCGPGEGDCDEDHECYGDQICGNNVCNQDVSGLFVCQTLNAPLLRKKMPFFCQKHAKWQPWLGPGQDVQNFGLKQKLTLFQVDPSLEHLRDLLEFKSSGFSRTDDCCDLPDYMKKVLKKYRTEKIPAA